MARRRTLPAWDVGAKLPEMVGAVIYVRVSTKEQTENLSLPTQLRACEEYCRRQGYEILERFQEEGESAKTTDRSQLQALLKYCRTHKGKVHFVVVYNLTRFAREKYDHFALHAHLKSLGISLRSATEPIDDTSTGKLMEGVLAAFAQFDNDVRSDRTRAGMKAALELGRWTFPAPLGYLNAPKWSTTSLVHDPERGPLVRQAFEDLATGQFTKQEVIARATEAGLRSRKGLKLSPQSFGQMMRNPIYAGKVESPDYGVSTKGNFEPLVDEATFYRAQAVLDGRIVVSGPRQRNHPDFPLRGFVRCEACGRPLTGSWSKGRNGHYAYYHCQKQCRAVNVSKAVLEGAFTDELALLQPSAGYMRLVKDRILYVWEQRRAEAKDRTVEQEKRVKLIRQKLDRLDDAFLFAQSIDAKTYERHRDRLREELTLAQIDHHAEATDELDVQGILAFAERILPRASDLWVQASLDYKQRLQALFFPEGIAYEGNRFNRTAATAPLFSYLAPSEGADEKMVTLPEIESIYATPLPDLIFRAQSVHRVHHRADEVQGCTLLSIKTGGCPEDCAYCPQSAHYQTGVSRTALVSLEELTAAATDARAQGATRFCMGAAWRDVPDGPEFDSVLAMVRVVRGLGMEACCTLGVLTQSQADLLADAGLTAYNHNLDTSPEFYGRIITTRTYDERLATLSRVRSAGITVCSGGIIGMGESRSARCRLLQQLSALDPHPESVPINLLVRVNGTPLAERPPEDPLDLVRMIATARILMPASQVRLSAGRLELSDEAQALCFIAGANSIFLGDRLLTTPNPGQTRDELLLDRLGMKLTAAEA